MIVPSSNIILLETPFELDYKNNLTFSNSTTQMSYFNSLPHTEITDATYQRKDNVIRYPALVDNILHYNYCMYQNENFSNKWFFAFITNMEYVNNNVTNISIETDVWQTYQFDITFKRSFVEREHVNNDTIGLHTIPEGLETGEYICNSHVIDDRFDDITSDFVYVFACSKNPYETDAQGKLKSITGGLYNGIYQGNGFFRCDNKTQVQSILESVQQAGEVDVITGLFIAPKELAPTTGDTAGFVLNSSSPVTYTNSISKQTTLNGYSPVNNKLKCYPYNYLIVSNNNGSSNILNYEDFSGSNCTFNIAMAITPGCSIRMVPTNYKGIASNDEYGVNMGKLPICSYNCDMYINWLTQNSINIAGVTMTSDDINIGMASSNAILGTLGNIASGNILGTVNSAIGGAGGIANSLIAKKQHELIPPQVRGNTNCGDVITSSNKNNFQFYKMSIKQEYAQIIDKYFSAFGYLVNDYKIPNITGRRNWNYVKTIDINITGNVIQEDMQKIRNIFNNGVTLWHNPSTYLDYSQINDII